MTKNDKKKEDSLKELEKLLSEDARVRDRVTGIIIRVAVSIVVIFLLYFTGILERPIYVSLFILVIVFIELVRYLRDRNRNNN